MKYTKEIIIVNKYMDTREFRNYVNTMFYKRGYNPITIDDARVSDGDEINDNDLLVTKDNTKYTVQTYLNTEIGDKHIEETLKDMEKEKVLNGIIVTNYYANKDVKKKAKEKNIIILDRSEFEDGIYN